MYLKSLEMHGFKSFPDKIKLDFNKGISAVVGPNGSGKSNIGDAMRWVLGEQSSKTLRGGKMEDVIFNGSKSRPKAGFALVTLTIDNSDRSLGNDKDTVSVTRKLYRNGDSEYLINGENVRLKDVTELFMDTGLGRDGYSIIGQGKIADIVSSKSTERREIFEEAAGISKFRYKKEEAERKLVAAEDNISRLNDILGELENRIGPLQKQCEKAKKFKVLADEKQELEISVWVCRLNEISEKIGGYEEKLNSLGIQYTALEKELDTLEDGINDAFAKSAEKSQLIDSLREKIHQTELEKSKAGADCAVHENDIEHLKAEIARLNEQIEQSANSKYFLESELEKKRKDLKNFDFEISKLNEEISQTEKSFLTLASKTDDFDKSLAESGSEVNTLYLNKSKLSYRLEAAKNSLSEAQDGLENSLEEKQEIESKSRFADSELENLIKSKDKTSQDKSDQSNRLAGYTKLLETKNKKLNEIADSYRNAEIGLRETVQKLGLLQDLESSMEGFAYSVKHIMTASRQGRISGICGSVAQLIGVDSKYSVAIETALGGALQNIIVENEDAAKRSIRLLKDAKAGRATFLPITSVKGKRLDNVPENEEGYVAMACDIVSCDEKYRSIAQYLLGRICVAEDIDFAAVIAKKYGYKFKIVTLDGQIVNAGGSFTGGSVSKSTGILTRKNEIERLANDRNKLQAEFDCLKDKREKLLQETAKLNADIDGVKEKLDILSKEEIRLDMEIKRVREYTVDYSEKLKSAEEAQHGFLEKIKQAEREINDINAEIAVNEKAIGDAENALEASKSKLEDMKAEREKISTDISALRMKGIELSKDKDACTLAIEQLEASINGNADDSGKLSEQIAENEKEIESKRKEISQIQKSAESSDSVIDGIKLEIEAAGREHSAFDMQANKLRSEQKTKMDEKESLSNEINRTSERKNSACTDFDKLVAQLWDEYELTRTEAEERAQIPENITEANARLTELKNKIKALGNVNLAAIDEYDEVSKRYEFMKAQLDDVNTSKLELEGLIGDLTDTMKEMFTVSFEQINKNFKEIFTELFGGGNGELLLTDSENVLESGIEIKVEPPGKIIKNLLSLSGGEQSFVAICIYFAILKIRPSPFCLLDEIEAALDDVNVTKYAQYLHRFTDTTQFITITHRRGTMEEADVLYGVTMQESGVSKLLKMTMEDTEKLTLNR